MDNEPNEREREIAQDAINKAFGETTIDPDLERAFSNALADYRAELRPPGDREAAEKHQDKLNVMADEMEILSRPGYIPTKGGLQAYFASWIPALREYAKDTAAALTAARAEGVRIGHKVGWESAMYDAHINYGADEDAPEPGLTDNDIAALLAKGAEGND